jgi:hypothetical protein
MSIKQVADLKPTTFQAVTRFARLKKSSAQGEVASAPTLTESIRWLTAKTQIGDRTSADGCVPNPGPPSNELPGYDAKPVPNRFLNISRRIHSVAACALPARGISPKFGIEPRKINYLTL